MYNDNMYLQSVPDFRVFLAPRVFSGGWLFMSSDGAPGSGEHQIDVMHAVVSRDWREHLPVAQNWTLS
jgi:hypothetical protein